MEPIRPQLGTAFGSNNEYADKCGIGKALEEFKENPSYVPHIATIVGVETVCFGVRLASKVYRFTSWGPDDFLIAAAYVLSVATLPLTVISSSSYSRYIRTPLVQLHIALHEPLDFVKTDADANTYTSRQRPESDTIQTSGPSTLTKSLSLAKQTLLTAYFAPYRLVVPNYPLSYFYCVYFLRAVRGTSGCFGAPSP
ncbi:hypothetical protein CH63R_14015 [Colletotrichum higginsianum IMI 349063]|uniref:Uncharacterized protein n=1 Tax=Colletotrichum higginsianum (strain IMI 349063) TaxID=759273 RepID=A0A1B7XSQ1_COLHI|nr:hypothetical protein CH63R_14015 [Colletotrichum higginsianum IMI 349063]OBR02789.1 hypothetical protein CH63R_14015 [Colletotrichum higginsianum IMI 349063]